MPPANLAPVVSAGTNQAVLWPAPASLNGTATDDAKPNPPGTVALAWSKVSGPGMVTFGNPNAQATTASFSTGGTYGLQLVADDGQVSTASTLLITAITRPTLSLTLASGLWTLSWMTNGGNWRLQSQTNPLSIGLGTNWFDVPGAVVTSYVEHIDPSLGGVFHRLVLTGE